MANDDPYGAAIRAMPDTAPISTSIRNRLAMAQLQASMSTDPVRSKWQGAARLSDTSIMPPSLCPRGRVGQRWEDVAPPAE